MSFLFSVNLIFTCFFLFDFWMCAIFQATMDLHLDLEEEEVEYLESIGIAETLGETLTQALKSLSSEKPPEPLLSLVVEGMARAAGKGL